MFWENGYFFGFLHYSFNLRDRASCSVIFCVEKMKGSLTIGGLHGFRAKQITFFQVNRVEYQKLNQTTP